MESQVINMSNRKISSAKERELKRMNSLKYLRAQRIYENRIRKKTNLLVTIAITIISACALSLFFIFE